MHKKTLVTGGTGTVGFGVAKISKNYPDREFLLVGSKDCNLLNLNDIVKYIKKNNIDSILHLAALSGGIQYSTNYPATILRGNVLMNLNIVEAACLTGVKKTLMTLSTGMYNSDVNTPILEEYIHDGPPHKSNYSYSFAKRLIEPMIRSYRTEYKMSIIGVIPNGILGERSNFNYEASTMVPALIRRFFENKTNDSKITIWGDGTPLREITYADDIAAACIWCLDNYDQEQILHIGSTEEHSVKEYAYTIAEIMNIDKTRIEFDTSKPAGQFRKNTDNSKFVKLSNFKYTPFKDGLEYTIRYFGKYYPDKEKLRL